MHKAFRCTNYCTNFYFFINSYKYLCNVKFSKKR
nr:MAG TPA: hypothetical protein [Bacteriophage sp.]DAW00816.1 MAG TPA: hypothetical protein [Bacteriophage sp.]DAX12005.1 MAG TPA: hypothetical protein [Bacteriophage sp.]